LQAHPHLSGIFLPTVEKGSVMLSIGNDFAEAHRCFENRFSSDPRQSPNAVLTPFGWMLRGIKLDQPSEDSVPASGFIVRELMLSSNVDSDLRNSLITVYFILKNGLFLL